jgi:hypothetical protein
MAKFKMSTTKDVQWSVLFETIANDHNIHKANMTVEESYMTIAESFCNLLGTNFLEWASF